jgi:hypothetical protein
MPSMTWTRLESLIARTSKTFSGTEGAENAGAAWGTRDSMALTARQHRFLERPVVIPENYQATTDKFLSPLPFDQIQRIVADITHDAPVVKVPPLSEDNVDLEASSLKEKWAMAMMRAMDHDAGESVWKMGVDGAVAEGMGIIKLQYHPRNYSSSKGYPQSDEEQFTNAPSEDVQRLYEAAVEKFKRRADLPFSWRTVDLLSYRPVYGPDGRRVAVIEVHKLDIESLLQRFAGHLQVGSGGNLQIIAESEDEDIIAEQASWTGEMTGEYILYEYWSVGDTKNPGEWGIWVEGMRMDGGENPFKDELPYFEIRGLQTSVREPSKRSLPVIFPSMSLYDHLNTEVTKRTQISHQYGYPSWKRTGGFTPNALEESAGSPTTGETLQVGTIYDLELGGDIAPIIPADLGHLSDAYIGFLMQMEQNVGLNAVTRGSGLGSEASGVLFSAIDAAARGIYGPIAETAEQAMGGVLRLMFKCISTKLKTGVVVKTWVTGSRVEHFAIDGDDIGEYYDIRVRLSPRKPSSLMARGNFAAAMVKARLLDRITAMDRYLDDPYPEETIRAIEFDEMKATPAYRQAKFQAVMKKRLGLPSEQPPGASPGNAPATQLSPNTQGNVAAASAVPPPREIPAGGSY